MLTRDVGHLDIDPADPTRTPSTRARAANTMNRGVMYTAILLVVLIASTVWAFSEDTTPKKTAAGVRVSPSSAYNPVTAGDPLPDGFRQLLPRDAIRPVYDPQFVPADQVGWHAETDVIGVTIDGEAKAYPVSFLNGRELVVDELGNLPILVSW